MEEKKRFKRKPDSDLYPPYSSDYYNDMEVWKSENPSCEYPKCECCLDCKHTPGLVRDLAEENPDVIF